MPLQPSSFAILGAGLMGRLLAVELARQGHQVDIYDAGSPAAEAGLRTGDVITKIDDTLITSSDSLVATIRSYRPGDEVEVTYLRDGQEQTTTLELDSDAESSTS